MKSPLNFNDLNNIDSSPSALNDWFLHRLGGRSLRVIKRFLDKQGMTREKEIPVCTGMTGKNKFPDFIAMTWKHD
ncbi:MAG: hypothetical protein N2319_12730 [Candidatus Kapabacteria bacterium]|nr:hypothetical protein [Candidatus Kapabacteria bacterium]